MLNIPNTISLIIKNKYNNTKNFYINKGSDDIYELIPHSSRYSILKYTLTFVSLPFTMLVEATKFLTFGTLSFKYLDIGKILLNKMNQNISKKILQGLPEETDEDQTIPKIVEYVLKNYEKQPELITQSKNSLIKESAKKIGEYIPVFSKFVKFWGNGGINYSDEIQKKQPIIDLIYKKIISEAYNVGKRGEKLEISDVKALFPQIDFEEKVKLDTEEIVITDDPIACKQLVLEQTLEKTIEPIDITNDQEIIVEDSLACNQQPSEQNTEKPINNLNNAINSLTNLTALYILCGSLIKTFEEHYIVEHIYSQKLSTTLYQEYTEPSPYYDNALLGNDSSVIACY